MSEPPQRPPEDDETIVVPPDEGETVVVPPDETVAQDEWAVAPERRVAVEDTTEEAVPPPDRNLWPWLLALLALVLVVLGVVFFLSRDDDEDAATTTTAGMVTVPDVVGRTEDDATTALEAVGLEVGVTNVPSPEEPGTVVAQAPGGGNEVEAGTSVSLKVAEPVEGTTTAPPPATTAPPPTTTAPPPTTTAPPATTAPPTAAVVPDVVGRPASEAAQAFAEEGLYIELAYVVSVEPAGTIVAQAQDPGTELRAGDFVQINASTGPNATEFVSTPDVVELRLDEARTALEEPGFEVLALNLQDEVENTDTVDGQTPEAGAGIPRGSLVVVYVSR